MGERGYDLCAASPTAKRSSGNDAVLLVSRAECRVFTKSGEEGSNSHLLLLGEGTSTVLDLIEPIGDERQVFELAVG